MSSCDEQNICGIGGVEGPSPSEPSGGFNITAEPAFGGIKVTWTYPIVNPEGVRHMLLFRQANNTTTPAVGAPPYQTVPGTYFYDAIRPEDSKTYSYWIKVVSFSGTVSGYIGPASAVARDTISNIIDSISLDIDNSRIASSLRSYITGLVPSHTDYAAFILAQKKNYTDITSYINNNTKAVQDSAAVSIKINSQLQTANESILLKQEMMYAYHKDAIAAIGYTSKMKVGYSAFEQYPWTVDPKTGNRVQATTGPKEYIPYDGNGIISVYKGVIDAFEYSMGEVGNTSYLNQLKDKNLSLSGGSKLITTIKDTWYGEGSNRQIYQEIKSKIALWPAGDQDAYYRIFAYAAATTLIIDAVGVAEWNAIDENSPQLIWVPGLPLAEIGRKAQVQYKGKDGEAKSMKIEEALSTQVDLNDRLLGQYFVKMHASSGDKQGLISGFGLVSTYSDLSKDGTPIDDEEKQSNSTFLVNANEFAIGAPSGGAIEEDTDNAAKPFIVRTTTKMINGKESPPGAYIKAAFIDNLTFNAITSDDSAFTHKDGETFAHTLTVASLHVGNPKAQERMEVTNEVIKIYSKNVLRVKIGRLN